MDTSTKKKIVVIGGGFAGLNFVKRIDKERFDVILIDRNNFHSFPPLFYQVASAGIDASGICFPLRRELRKYRKAKGLFFHMARARAIDTEAHTVTTDEDTLHYDKLIIAAGTTNNFFNMPELRDTVYTLKSISEAIRCRNDIMDRLERACMESDPENRRRLLSFVVIGGGPTGVEVAGALGEMKRYVLPREYRQINQDEVTITLIEGTDRVLRTMSEKSSAEAAKYLESLMVQVRLGHNMKQYDDDIVTLDNDEQIPAAMLIWTAGVKGVDFDFAGETVKPGRGNRIEVDQYCRVKGVNDVYALGDIAAMSTPDYPAGHPQLAQVAIQQAIMVARDINRGKVTEGFRYKDKGTMATVGRNRAVVDLNHIHFKGFFAWVTWMVVHLMSLLGMRNKVSVFIDWIWDYFTYSSSTRLLMHPGKYPLRKRWLKE
ncbi:MAG: NAD(P)/FAD-dependent oxidoreductase [Muribaculaceae bacterium]|nr:NAD(P)/FAD-dependent oxidoreductase [Muribaculaceae bacterium]